MQEDSSGYQSIYYKNLATGAYFRILPSTQNQEYPKISGTRIVWTKQDSSPNYSIYILNLATGQSGRLTP
jgi:beta propeller repeat protein